MATNPTKPTAEPTPKQQHWAEAVIECVSDKAERERLIGLYEHDELVKACLALGTLALTAKNEYQRAERLEHQARRQRELLREAMLYILNKASRNDLNWRESHDICARISSELDEGRG